MHTDMDWNNGYPCDPPRGSRSSRELREELSRTLERVVELCLADASLRERMNGGELKVLWRKRLNDTPLALVVLPDETLPPLTKRQEEVLRLLGHGHGNARIAWLLGIGENTVKFHLKNLSKRWGVTSRAALARRAALLYL